MAIVERERPVAQLPPDPPHSIVHQLLALQNREHAEQREQARRVAEVHRERYRLLATGTANALHDLRGFLAANENVVRAAGLSAEVDVTVAVVRRFTRALDHAEVVLVDPTGRTYADVEKEDMADVVHAPDTADASHLVVVRTLRPAVLLPGGELAQRARILLGEPGSGTGDAGYEGGSV